MTLEVAPHGPLFVETWLERSIMAVLAPMCGTRAIGKALVKAASADVLLRGGSHAVRVVEEDNNRYSLDFTRIYKVAPAAKTIDGVYDCKSADVTVTNAGVEVSMLAVGGGTGHELDVGAKLMWWPPIVGMDPTLEVTEAIDGAIDATHASALKHIVGFDELGVSKADAPEKVWRANLTELSPAGVLTWMGATSQTVGRGASAASLCKEDFQLYIFNADMRTPDQRRHDSRSALGHAHALLNDRASVDNIQFSNPHIQVTRRGFVTASDQSYVYVISFQVASTRHRIDERQFSEWLIAQQIFLTTATAQYPGIENALTLLDVSIDMG